MARQLVTLLAVVLAVSVPSSASGAVHGAQRVLVLPATWGPRPFAVEDVEQVAAQADEWVRRGSFGLASLESTVTPWLNVEPERRCDPAGLAEEAKAAARRAGYDTASYSRFAVVQPQGTCAFGGIALGSEVVLNGRLHPKVLVHELGHTWGLDHARLRECSDACRIVEYGDRYDAMGWGTGDFNAFEKVRLGWVTNVARASDASSVDVAALERPSVLPHALVVTTAEGEFWFELRSEPGLAAPWAPPWHALPPGVLVRTTAPPTTSERYDTPVLLSDAAQPGRPALVVGEQFDVSGAFSVRVASLLPERARLEFAWTDSVPPTRPRVDVRTGRRRVAVRWRASDTGSGLSGFTARLDGRMRRFDGDARESTFPRPSPGTHVLVVTAFDRAGNRTSTSRVLRLAGSTARPPVSGRRVDIGGYSLYVECRGTGSPTVVLDAGLGNDHFTWSTAAPQIAGTTRVCSYDRADLGQSDARPGARPVTAGRIVDELHALLVRAAIPGPYVLVGHSLGGLHITVFAHRHRELTAAFVFVDSVTPQVMQARGVVSAYETVDVRAAATEVLETRFGDIPAVVVYSGATPSLELARRSTNSSVVLAKGAGHYIHNERPDLVVEAIREAVFAARGQEPVLPCLQSPLPLLGGACMPLA